MNDEQSGEGVESPPLYETADEQSDDRPLHDLGEKADAAVHRMEKEGPEMSREARRLLEEGKEALNDLVGRRPRGARCGPDE
jgi:hypothetical protein